MEATPRAKAAPLRQPQRLEIKVASAMKTDQDTRAMKILTAPVGAVVTHIISTRVLGTGSRVATTVTKASVIEREHQPTKSSSSNRAQHGEKRAQPEAPATPTSSCLRCLTTSFGTPTANKKILTILPFSMKRTRITTKKKRRSQNNSNQCRLQDNESGPASKQTLASWTLA